MENINLMIVDPINASTLERLGKVITMAVEMNMEVHTRPDKRLSISSVKHNTTMLNIVNNKYRICTENTLIGNCKCHIAALQEAKWHSSHQQNHTHLVTWPGFSKEVRKPISGEEQSHHAEVAKLLPSHQVLKQV
jgi:hypothetical protein